MFTLKKARLPQAVEVGGSFYNIHTDYRYFLRFIELSKDKNVKAIDFDFMYTKGAPNDRVAGLRALRLFMDPPQELPRHRNSKDRVLDYELDAPYIYAAFLEQYGVDLLQANLHWYQFCALLRGLHDTELNNIINARLWKPTGKRGEYEKFREKQYEAWRLPDADDEKDEALDEFMKDLKG